MGATFDLNQRLMQPIAGYERVANFCTPFSGIDRVSLTPFGLPDTVSNRAGLDVGFDRGMSHGALFSIVDGLATKPRDGLAPSRPPAQVIASEMGDAKLLNVLDAQFLEYDLNDNETGWTAAVDQALTELEKTPEA